MSVVFVRTDRRTFERAFFEGARVAVDKNGRSDRANAKTFTTGTHTVKTSPRLLMDLDGDGPSRPGEGFNFYVAIFTPAYLAETNEDAKRIAEEVVDANFLSEMGYDGLTGALEEDAIDADRIREMLSRAALLGLAGGAL